MKNAVLVCLLFLSASCDTKSPSSFGFLGMFSNMTGNEEHESGFNVYLWQDRDSTYGYLEYSFGGLVGDFSTALVEAARLDTKSGEFSFRAKNPVQDETGGIIRYTLLFYGRMRGESIDGTISCPNIDNPNDFCRESDSIHLVRTPSLSGKDNDIRDKRKWRDWMKKNIYPEIVTW